MAVTQRLDRSFDNMGWRGEIRLADSEIDDVAALRSKFHCPRQYGKCVFLTYAIKSGDRL
jgi:hypothetical protein